MALKLYPHQAQVSQAVQRMLESNGRAAVILPTGTGKSYIAFHLIEQHPKAAFVWLAPSEYIYRTQTERLRRTNPELSLNHVTFCTYASLLYRTEEELSQLVCDFIILDEFHRCGSEHWGAAVQRLIESYPQAKLLGLSATHIRYLDHQRNMAEELLDNCIAAEMTLGEAIVRGILPAPKYVTTVYQYQKSLTRYEERIASQRNRRNRERSERYLQALRRMLEQAEGLDVVFANHMTDKHGRYIVFCASVEHMREILSHVRDWFHSVDPEPHCYQVYAENAEASESYNAFQQDESGHLKLLFCVNMLNEGVHVDGISGVILFRPTVSPIIYKKQIGRALTAGGQGCPLILDVVNNVEGLYSIDSVGQEMLDAAFRLRSEGRDELIVREKFRVIDQVKDCRKLFEQLEGGLHIDWEEYYQAAATYREAHGDLMIPQRYVTEDSKCLGRWLVTQRRIHNNGGGTLTGEQMLRLEALGIVWDDLRQFTWESCFAQAEAYYQAHGNLQVPQDYVTEDGCRLGQWLTNLRTRYRELREEDKTGHTLDKIRRLGAIGMTWNTFDARWEMYFAAAERYYREHGDLLVSARYQTASGLKLGIWIFNQRSKRKKLLKGKLTDEQISRLNAIGMVWDSTMDQQWMRYYTAAKTYFEQNGNLRVSKRYETEEGLKLGIWLVNQRTTRKKGDGTKHAMSDYRIRMLSKIGMQW